MSRCTLEYVMIPATIVRDARIGREASNSKEDINCRKPAIAGTPATARMKATSETPTIPGMTAKAGSPATVRISGLKGTPEIAGMIETADMQTAGTEATAKTQTTTVTIIATEMPETVLSPASREFSRKTRQNSKNSWKKYNE
jgi:hypothetical protein